MMLAYLYDALNRLFGTPTHVSPEIYTRTETQFRERAIPLLSEINSYIAPNYHILIVGCGSGAEIEWFAKKCESVVAVDVVPGSVDKSTKRSENFKNVDCILVDDRILPFDNEQFDMIFMHNVCEHIINIEECFSEYFRVIKPGKLMINTFAPLFYSPYGAHLQDALKVPWGHLIFGLRATVEVRNRYYPGYNKASNWAELGLNRITERRYRKIVKSSGFCSQKHSIQTSKNIPILSHIPFIRNLFILGITDILVKPFPKNAQERNEDGI